MLSLVPRELHSSGFHLLSVPRSKTHADSRAFSVAVPTLWNWLLERVKSSNSIASFHEYLQTHLSDLLTPPHVSTAHDHLLVNFASFLDYDFIIIIIIIRFTVKCSNQWAFGISLLLQLLLPLLLKLLLLLFIVIVVVIILAVAVVLITTTFDHK